MYKISQGVDNSKGEKIVIYGVEGVGKTTLASYLPDPIFIDTEGGTSKYDFIRRFQPPKDWEDLLNMVTYFGMEKPGKTLVIDTLDWAERAQIADMLIKNKWKSIESPGYGKGYIVSAERIGAFLDQLTSDLIDKGINVALLCHSKIVKIELPDEQGSYDKYELKLGKKTGSQTAALVKEWADVILFCNYKTYVEAQADGMGQTKYKATGGQERVIYTQHSAVWDAKNRCGLPEEMPMTAASINKIFGAQQTKKTAEKPEEKKPAAEPAKKKPVQKKAEQPDPQEQPAETIEKDEILPGSDTTEKDQELHGTLIFPDEVPQKVKDFCASKSIYVEDVQRLLFEQNIVKDEHFDLAKVPAKFWQSFVKDYDSRWSDPMMKAQLHNMPF